MALQHWAGNWTKGIWKRSEKKEVWKLTLGIGDLSTSGANTDYNNQILFPAWTFDWVCRALVKNHSPRAFWEWNGKLK